MDVLWQETYPAINEVAYFRDRLEDRVCDWSLPKAFPLGSVGCVKLMELLASSELDHFLTLGRGR